MIDAASCPGFVFLILTTNARSTQAQGTKKRKEKIDRKIYIEIQVPERPFFLSATTERGGSSSGRGCVVVVRVRKPLSVWKTDVAVVQGACWLARLMGRMDREGRQARRWR